MKTVLGHAALAIGLVSAMSLGGASSPALAEEYVARIGHLEAPTQPRHLALEKVAELVSERTGGEVEFQLFPSSQLGNAREMNEGVQLGTIEGTVMPAAFLGGFNPVVSILDIPFLLPDDPEDARELRNGPFGAAILDSFDRRGFEAIALWPNGRKSFTSNKPLNSIEDFKGQRFRVMDSNILIKQFDALGASAIALPFGELYTALQTGVVDGEENPLDTIATMRFHEVQDYLVVSEHGAMEDVVLFNPGWWESLPEQHRETIVQAFREVAPELAANKAAAQETALRTITDAGVDVRVLTAEEKDRMRALTYPETRQAYVERAGAEGQALIDVYEREYQKMAN